MTSSLYNSLFRRSAVLVGALGLLAFPALASAETTTTPQCKKGEVAKKVTKKVNNGKKKGWTTNELTICVRDKVRPTKVTGLQVVSGDSAARLTWAASTDNVAVTGYQISRNGRLLTTVTETTYTDLGLKNRKPYSYKVVAVDAAGNRSTPVLGRAKPFAGGPDLQAPTAPLELTATAGDAKVDLAWKEASDNIAVTGYEVWRDGKLLDTVTTLSYSDSGLTNGTTYAYTVVAVDAGKNSSPPATASATPVAPPAPPAPPADTQKPTAPVELTATAGDAKVDLAWKAASDNVAVTGYEVWRDGKLLDTVTTLSYSDSSLANGTTYNYEVVAVDAAKNASAPAKVSATPAVPPVVDPPVVQPTSVLRIQ